MSADRRSQSTGSTSAAVWASIAWVMTSSPTRLIRWSIFSTGTRIEEASARAETASLSPARRPLASTPAESSSLARRPGWRRAGAAVRRRPPRPDRGERPALQRPGVRPARPRRNRSRRPPAPRCRPPRRPRTAPRGRRRKNEAVVRRSACRSILRIVVRGHRPRIGRGPQVGRVVCLASGAGFQAEAGWVHHEFQCALQFRRRERALQVQGQGGVPAGGRGGWVEAGELRQAAQQALPVCGRAAVGLSGAETEPVGARRVGGGS